MGAKLYKYVINVDRLIFLDVSADDLELFGVERLSKVLFANNGHSPVVDGSGHSTTSTRVERENNN